MQRIARLACLPVLFATLVAPAKDKKPLVPPYVLTAHTVRVLVEPDAGMDAEDPRANQVAQDDVEKALIRWGRFEPVMQDSPADLVITVRRGHKNTAQPTIAGPRISNRPAVIGPIDNGGRIGAEQGTPPDASQGADTSRPMPDTGVHPQVEVGATQDVFTVYRGDVERPTDQTPAYRYYGRDALQSPDVPAVSEFRKAIAETEKRINQKKQP
jgi:hypothetical protein